MLMQAKKTIRYTVMAASLMTLNGCMSEDVINVVGAVATGMTQQSGELTQYDISNGLKEALRIGTGRAVGVLSLPDGYNGDSNIRIQLPSSMTRAREIASLVGATEQFTELELMLNRAAEAAAPEAKGLFVDAIKQMSLTDAQNILSGSDDAATQFFKQKMSNQLAVKMAPIVTNTLSQVGVITAYDNALKALGPAAPLLPDYKAQLTQHVVQKGMDGLFVYLAKEEAQIRQNPVKRTTELLKRVFGQVNAAPVQQ